MSVLDRYLGELQALRTQVAVESLENPVLQDGTAAVAYGRAVGRMEGLKLAEELLSKVLRMPEDDGDGPRRSRSKA